MLTMRDVIDQVADLSDESPEDASVVNWVNDALSEIGIKVKATFPEMSVTDLSGTFPFDDKWVRALLIPYASGRATQKEASQFQYRDYYAQFESNLMEFVNVYTVPDLYKDVISTDNQTSSIFTEPPFSFWRW